MGETGLQQTGIAFEKHSNAELHLVCWRSPRPCPLAQEGEPGLISRQWQVSSHVLIFPPPFKCDSFSYIDFNFTTLGLGRKIRRVIYSLFLKTLEGQKKVLF